ncbi:PKD domain-containing protein [Thermophagus sp. OGC60D27]|uniref:PKD domain-containing protein n=1 Tax=Thermophagus sp. OGC60D27 TaxID=3458415 RepID=UPI004038013B
MRKQILTGLIFAAMFFMLPDQNNYAQSCDYQGGQNDDWIFDKRCAPVTVQRIVTFRGVNDGGTGNVSIYFDWGDGSVPDIVPATEISPGNWQAAASHIYPPGGDQCNYEARAYLMVDGILCTSSVQTQIATVWDVDNQNGGAINISPEVFPICIGEDGSIQFTDNSQWNCTPPDEEDTPNFRHRWTQWIYGTDTTNINTARVNGITHAWPYAGPINYYSADTVLSPTPPASLSEVIQIPSGYNVGDRFIVTLRNWNTCNPYDDPDIPGPPVDPVNGDNDPVISTAMAIIVDLPDNGIASVGPLCETDPEITLIPATPGGTWSGPGINPTSGTFNPSEAGPGTHTIQYEVTNSNGCSTIGSINLEVKGAPDINIVPGNAIFLCPGIDLQLNAEVTGGTPPYSIQWIGDTIPLSTTNIINPTFNTVVVGSHHLTALVSDNTGCTNQTDITIEVQDVSVNFDPNPIIACAGQIVELSPIVSGGSTIYSAHQWSGPNTDKLSATDIANPDFHSAETGTFNFVYQVFDDLGCSDQTTVSVIVKEQPLANAGSDEQTCSTDYQLQGNFYEADSSHWSVISGPGSLLFEDPTQGNSLVTADQYGTYLLAWELNKEGCKDADTISVTFSKTPEPNIADDYQICGTTGTIEAFPDTAGGHWTVISGPGNATINDSNSPFTAVEVDTHGSYTFTWREVTPDGCWAEVSQGVEFLPQAIAQIAPFESENCSSVEINFENNSINADNFHWDFGDGSASNLENPSHIFATNKTEPDTLIIMLQANNNSGCNDTTLRELILKPVPIAFFEAEPIAGCSPLEVFFSNTSTGATQYSWNFGDSTSISHEESPKHTFTNSQNYVQSFRVELTAENSFGCSDVQTLYTTVYPVREITLTANPQEGCSPLTSQLSTEAGAKEYQWDFGYGTTTTAQYQSIHTFENNTTETISLTAKVTGISSFGCPEEASVQVTVFSTPQPNFSVTPEILQMPDRTVSLDNQTNGTWNFYWDFGDGTGSDLAQPQNHQYNISGNYNISLRAFSDYCEAILSKSISITPMTPSIVYGPDTSGCLPLTVEFFNNTLDANAFLWDFGDGTFSDERTPSHTYRIPGDYTVSLTAYGAGGQSTESSVSIQVHPVPTALFEPVPKVVYIPTDGVTFLNKSEGAVSYFWEMGEGTTSNDFSPTHIYDRTGSYDVTLEVFNEFNCSDKLTIPNAVKAMQGGQISFPNAFTPGKNGPSDGKYQYGDRHNLIFYPFVQKGIVEYQLQIYSRWGELIFESKDISRGWDGYYRNSLCPQGVYIWRVIVKYSDGRRIEKTGDVTLLR